MYYEHKHTHEYNTDILFTMKTNIIINIGIILFQFIPVSSIEHSNYSSLKFKSYIIICNSINVLYNMKFYRKLIKSIVLLVQVDLNGVVHCVLKTTK
jgi:hypothetical protein